MNHVNRRVYSASTYPAVIGGIREKYAPVLDGLPLKGDTVVGNDI